MATPYAYGPGFRNYLQEVSWQPGGGSALGGQVNQAAVARAYHNAARLWSGAGPALGGGRMPNLDLTGLRYRAAGQAWSPNNPHSPLRASWVGLHPEAIRLLSRGIATPATKVALHEWAHIFQSPQTYRQGLYEGAAEAYMRSAMAPMLARLGKTRQQRVQMLKAIGPANTYQQEMRQAYQRGLPWVLHGQFR